MKDKKRLIILSYYHFPCHHPVLENVFAKTLGRYIDILWLFQGDTSNGKTFRWYNSTVRLCRVLKGNSLIVKLLNRILGWQRLLLLVRELLVKEEQIVLIRDMPLWALLISPLRKILNFKLYYQYSAPQAEIRRAIFKSNRGLHRYWHLSAGICLEKFTARALKNSDMVFPISEFHKKMLTDYISPEKLVPLTMGVDKAWLSRPRKQINRLKRLKKDNYIITYFGTLSFARNPKFIIDVFRQVINTNPNCKLLLIGETQNVWEKKKLQEYCKDLLDQKKVIFTGKLDHDTLQDYLQYCDLSLSAIPPERHYIISSPTKLYESLGNGIPVVANREILEQEKVLKESGGGVLVSYCVDSFYEAVISLLKDESLRQFMAYAGKTYVIKNYNYRVLGQRIVPLFM